MKLIVGLGNPGQEYAKTRHNIGFVMIERFVQEHTLGSFSYDSKYKSELLSTSFAGDKVIFCKPQTYMNRSGDAVAPLANFYKIPVKDILVVHDEIDFVTGRIAMKLGGSAAGHNGLKSLIERLGTPDFARIRVGVDRPTTGKSVADYVLSSFTADENHLLDEKYTEVAKLIETFLT